MEPVVIILILTGWVATGVATAFVMRQRGHDLWVWLALGSVLGSLIAPLAIEWAQDHEGQKSIQGSAPIGVGA